MHFEVLSLFPEYIQGPLEHSILKRALTKGLIRISSHDIRDHAEGKHRKVDDRPYGGGPGMVLMPEPVVKAVQERKKAHSTVLYLSPQGRRLSPSYAKELAQKEHLILLCGHYEGIDIRALNTVVDEEVSIGDYVLTNGCLAALVVIDVVSRYIPDVLGDERAAVSDSFESPLLEFPLYTRPEVYHGEAVPEVLLSGNHKEADAWQKRSSLEQTWEKRADLFAHAALSSLPSSGQIREVSLPASPFDASCKFYEKLFEIKPSVHKEGAMTRASWQIPDQGLTYTLYDSIRHDSPSSLGPVLHIQLSLQKCIDIILWSLRKQYIHLPSDQQKPLPLHQQVLRFFEREQSMTLVDPSGHRILLSPQHL